MYENQIDMVNGKRYLTINTDASFCPQTKAGGYAFYIVCDNFRLTKSGAFKSKLEDPHDAELKCIINALYTLSVQMLPSVDIVIINTDSMNSIRNIEKNPMAGIYKYAVDLISLIKKKSNATEVKLKHVRAHTGVGDSRSWVNDWCDRQAKQWMRKERDKVTAKIS